MKNVCCVSGSIKETNISYFIKIRYVCNFSNTFTYRYQFLKTKIMLKKNFIKNYFLYTLWINIAINEYKSKAEKSVANLSKCNEKFNTNVTEEFKHILNII